LVAALLACEAALDGDGVGSRKISGQSAKAQGYKGRAPTARKKAVEIVRLKAEGKRAEEIAEVLKVSRASVFRILKAETAA
jgi:DNA invertase Pin-like site-specific DNA recombinase